MGIREKRGEMTEWGGNTRFLGREVGIIEMRGEDRDAGWER